MTPGGDPYYLRTEYGEQCPEGNALNGWKPFDGLRNRYWLVRNLLDQNAILRCPYNSYRLGLDPKVIMKPTHLQ
jgi:hypothetical protein